MQKILIVEDDAALRHGIVLGLRQTDRIFTEVRTLGEARAAVAQTAFSLVILDLNLPDGNGLELLSEIRGESWMPVLILTANDLETDQVIGLELGADDYVTKPFSLAILRARVANLLRRQPETGSYQAGGYRFSFDRLLFYKDDCRVDLSKTEARLLRLLVENRGQTLSRELLLDRIWDGGDFVEENALSVAVRRLRDKLEDDPSHPRHIKTVYGVGYTWVS